MRGLWKTLQAAGAEVVLNGHDHDYERFAPQTWQGQADRRTASASSWSAPGGTGLRPFQVVKANSEVRNHTAHGVLRLRLHDGMYRWRFISTDGAFSDTGTASCH